MALDHSCTDVETTMVEEQGCPDLAAEAGERLPNGVKSLEKESLGARPQRSKHPGKVHGW
jgi:hypothetical protein